MKTMVRQIIFLGLLALTSGAVRQWAPNGVSWKGNWPSSSSTAEEAYRMMAKPGDPVFISLADVIRLSEDPSSGAVFLDARSSTEFSAGHIPQARSLPFYELEKYQDAALTGVSAETPLIIYCEGIGCELSFFLGRDLQKAGYNNIHIFYGGFPEWKEAGRELEK
jgi:rhodanese-related sulfurtransferase